MSDAEVANQIGTELGVIRRVHYLGFVDIGKISINPDVQVEAGERARLAQQAAAMELRCKRDLGGTLDVGQGAPMSRGMAHIAAMAELGRCFGITRNDVGPSELAVTRLIADKSAETPALWNIDYLHINIRGSELPGPDGGRVATVGDSRGNPAYPTTDVSTKAGYCPLPFHPKSSNPRRQK